MAKKKSTIEDSIVEFFTTADTASRQTLFNVISGLMKRNVTTAAPVVVKTAVKRASSTKGPAAVAATTAAETTESQEQAA
jgi:hypothetical protein